ncbi:MAG: transglycosylase domain-containing protein, partial [Clostridia bacterium]|nr:transglycosylase domain-containing protein [Clostridia bacterium]
MEASVINKRCGIAVYLKPRTKKPGFLLSLIVATAWVTLIAILCCATAGLGAVVGIVRAYMATTPPLEIEKLKAVPLTSFIYDANGTEIMSYKGAENRVWADIEEIPQILRDAFVAIEDERFYLHKGVDYKRLFGAVIVNMEQDKTQGGSTITQQLIKNKLLSDERSYKRKLQEAYLAMQLETDYSKEQILEAYLNAIPMGGSNYGLRTAAEDYFNKELDQLTLRECATLAGITRSPSKYNPRLNYYSRNTPRVTDDRTNTVLAKMYENKFITREEYESAKAEPLFVAEKPPSAGMYSQAYAVEYAMRNVVEIMLKQKGLANTSENRAAMENDIRGGGYHIYTTIDPAMQQLLETTVLEYKDWPQMRNKGDNVARRTNPDGTLIEVIQPQCSVVLMDRETAIVRAVMGGRQLPTAMKQFNRVYDSHMPVGSSIKPLTCFGPALDAGASPATTFANIKAPVKDWDSERGYPKNYAEGQYSGPMTMREGIYRSINMVAARALMETVGLNTAADYLVKMGVDYDLSICGKNATAPTGSGLALGSSGLTTLEMAQAYCAVANEGMYQQAIAFTKITDGQGNVVLDPFHVRDKYQVYKPTTSWLLLDMMKDVVTKGTGRRAAMDGMTVAGKTGTNDDERGVFFSGITPYYVSTVWIGSDDYKPLPYGSAGGNAACPLWKAIMTKVLADREKYPNRDIIEKTTEEMGIIKGKFCAVSGMKPGSGCYGSVEDWCSEETYEELEKCDMHVSAVTCSASGRAAGSFCPEELREYRSVLVLPEDSPYRNTGDEPNFMPAALYSIPNPRDVLSLQAGDPRLRGYCNVHTPQSADWDSTEAIITRAQEVYAD